MGRATASERHRRTVADEMRVAPGAVRDAFLAVAREEFVPEYLRDHGLARVYAAQAPLVTKKDADGNAISSASAPAIVLPMLHALDVRPGQRVLEIGAGTGYNAALLKELVGPAGRVVSVDVDGDLVRRARAALRRSGHRVEVVRGDGRAGWPKRAPYDRIIATVSLDEVPSAWREQLADDGIVVMPLKLVPGASFEAVPVLGKTASGFAGSVHCFAGFMEVRDSGDAPSPSVLLKASAPGEWELQIWGAAVHRLDGRARRRLLALVTPAPERRRTLANGRESFGFWTYAALALGRDEFRLSFGRRHGIGVATRSCDSAAIVTLDGDGLLVVSWGTPEAEDRLGTMFAEWERAGRPGSNRLRVTVSYGSDGRSRVRSRWTPAPTR